MTTNDQIRFIISHHSEAGQKEVTDLDATVDYASKLVKDENLLWLFLDLRRKLNAYGYNCNITKEGEDL